VLLKEAVAKIRNGFGEPADLKYLDELAQTVKTTSRCGLGQTSPNPVLTTLKNFKGEYEKRLKDRKDGLQAAFDVKAALGDAQAVAGRKSVIFK
jgi:[NiFe] hydrogenase diaphorase moiety large subunit